MPTPPGQFDCRSGIVPPYCPVHGGGSNPAALEPISSEAASGDLELSCLIVLWVFLYAYLLFPYQYLFWNPAIYNPRFDILYAVENVALILLLGIATWRAQAPWRSICLHLLGASALYTFGSTLGNMVMDSGGYYNGSLYSLAQTASVCWFVWMPVRARQLKPARLRMPQPDASRTEYTSLLAVLAVVAIPLIGVWEVFRRDEPPGMQAFRLAVVLVSVLSSGRCCFSKGVSRQARTGHRRPFQQPAKEVRRVGARC